MWATWCACRAPDSGPWEELEVLSITEPFLQSLFKIFVIISSFIYFVYWGPLVAVIGESVGITSLLWLWRSCRANSIDQAWQQCFYPLRYLTDWETNSEEASFSEFALKSLFYEIKCQPGIFLWNCIEMCCEVTYSVGCEDSVWKLTSISTFILMHWPIKMHLHYFSVSLLWCDC